MMSRWTISKFQMPKEYQELDIGILNATPTAYCLWIITDNQITCKKIKINI